jgi:hypothetical protein
MVKSIKGWVEDNHNPGMFSKVINGELVQTYVPPDDNPHRMLAQVEAQLSNPVLLLVIPFLFFLMARWWRSCPTRCSSTSSRATQAACDLVVRRGAKGAGHRRPRRVASAPLGPMLTYPPFFCAQVSTSPHVW